MSHVTVEQTVSLYERNYRRVMLMLPYLCEMHGTSVIDIDGVMELRVTIHEHCRYTSIVSLSCRLPGTGELVPDPYMKIRVCHDARVAEVVAYQNCTRFRVMYPYPNRQMHQVREKRQVNVFLGEWLEHCLMRGLRLSDESILAGV